MGEVQKGICNYYFRDLLVENGFPSPVTKHIVCFLPMTFVVVRSTVSHCWHMCQSYSIYPRVSGLNGYFTLTLFSISNKI